MTTSTPALPRWFRPKIAYGLLALLSLVYVILTVFAPLDPHTKTYGLKLASLRGLELTIVLPIIAIWFVALWGSLRFKQYALSIGGSRDGRALGLVADGLLVLVFSLTITSVVQTVLSGVVRPHSPKVALITTHYVSLVLPLIAFGVIAMGAQRMSGLVARKGRLRSQLIALAAAAIMGIGFALLLAHDPYRQTSPNSAQFPSYYLPDWLIILTLVVPYLVQWYLGVLAAGLVANYQQYAGGVIYRAALVKLAAGLGAIIGSLVFIQLLTALGPSLSHLGLASLLALIYALVIIYAIGHVLVAWGARQLTRIEEAGL